MRATFSMLVMLLAVAIPSIVTAQGADVQAGRALWDGQPMCRNCHGAKGEGGFGPDLAGRELTLPQFIRAVRQPWGVMPAFTPQQMSDGDLANVVAYLSTLPAAPEPAAWRIPVPANAPRGERLIIATGCAQCHGAAMGGPRWDAAAVGAEFDWFAGMVYRHTEVMPAHQKAVGDPPGNVRMGNYSADRLPESMLRELWQYMTVDLGFRVPIAARAVPSGGSDVTYTITVENVGPVAKGLTAQDLTLTITLPPNASVAATTGEGYRGLQSEGQGGQAAVWVISRIGPKQSQSFTLSLTGPGARTRLPRGAVRWSRPAQRDGSGDTVNVAITAPPATAPTQ